MRGGKPGFFPSFQVRGDMGETWGRYRGDMGRCRGGKPGFFPSFQVRDRVRLRGISARVRARARVRVRLLPLLPG